MKRIFFLILLCTVSLSLFSCASQGNFRTESNETIESVFAADEFHPVVLAYMETGKPVLCAYVIGGSKDRKWFGLIDFKVKLNGSWIPASEFSLTEEQTVEIDLIKSGDSLRFYSDKEFIDEQKAQASLLYVSELSGEIILETKINPLTSNDIQDGSYVVGVNGDWNALPRILKKSDKYNYSVDIDNDGRDEALKILEKPGEKGEGYLDLKEITLVMQKDGKDVLIEESLLDGEYTNDYYINTLDLNGDGKLEVVTFTTGNNTTINIYQIDNDAKKVLSFYMGD